MNLYETTEDPTHAGSNGAPLRALNSDHDSLAPQAMDIPLARGGGGKKKLTLYALITLAVGAVAALVVLRLGPAAPAVERSMVSIDTVRRGELVREVSGQGLLVPEQVRLIAAKTAGRVEKILAKPGAKVTASEVILELSNTDLQLQALEADREVARAESELVSKGAELNALTLAQKSVVATINSELSEARRRDRADDALNRRGFLSELERAQTRDKAKEIAGRRQFEEGRLVALIQGNAAQLKAQAAEVERLRTIAKFRHTEVNDLKQVAGVDGVLQELPLQPGQTVIPGALLAKVVRADRLKAEIRVPETQAKDVQAGQKASIDTRNGVVAGRVVRMDPAAVAGSVLVEVALLGDLPPGARPDLNVQGTIEIERLPSVLHVGRPAAGGRGKTIGLFKLDDKGGAARTQVALGRNSVKSVEITSGLSEGDRVIVSDMSQWDQVEQIRLQ